MALDKSEVEKQCLYLLWQNLAKISGWGGVYVHLNLSSLAGLIIDFIRVIETV